MNTRFDFLAPAASEQDIAVVAKRSGKSVNSYMRSRMVEALMADIFSDILSHYDFSSEAQISKAVKKFLDLSDDFIRTIALFKFDAKRRRKVQSLRKANTEGKLKALQQNALKNIATNEADLAIVKAIAYLEAERRGLQIPRDV